MVYVFVAERMRHHDRSIRRVKGSRPLPAYTDVEKLKIMKNVHELIPVLSKEEIDRLVVEIAGKISNDYKNQELVLIGVLKGAFIFLSDLCRHLTIPVHVDFIQASSYGDRTSSSGRIRMNKDIDIDIRGKHILVIEDIVDTGLTLSWLIEHFKNYGAASVKICTMIDKRERRDIDIRVDYSCYTVKAGFLVGYGLDYAENYRELPGIFHLKI